MTNLIFIHGVNSQTTGYSNRLFKNIVKAYRRRLNAEGKSKKIIKEMTSQLIQKEIIWANVTTDLINRYLFLEYGLKKRSGKWNLLFKQIDPLAIQVMHYVRDKGHNRKAPMGILKSVDLSFKNACLNKPDKIIIIAHSLGSVIAFDYVFGFRRHKLSPKIKVQALITLGSPIAMFTTAMGFTDSKIKLPKNVRRWINIMDPDDGIARLCKPFFKNIPVQDILINTHWSPLGAHTAYWKRRYQTCAREP